MDRRTSLLYDLVQNRTTVDERRSISTAFFARDLCVSPSPCRRPRSWALILLFALQTCSAALVDALGEPDGLMTYYGPSYGTVVGATFAGMFPEKVGRMILDGVVCESESCPARQ